MSRLIDADALRKKATVVTEYDEDGWGVDLLAVPLCDVELAPTIEAEPVRHGRWVHDYNNVYACDNCLEREAMSNKNKKPYCPNCGAKMDTEDV